MTKPTIHTNGTSADELCDAYCTAMTAISDAAATLCKTCPNGRDYYPQGAGTIQTALAEHHARLARLREIHAELEQLAEHCADHLTSVA